MPNRFIDRLQRYIDLTPVEIEALTKASSSVRRFAARTDIVRQGDPPGALLVMLEGWAMRYTVLVNGSRQVTAFMMPGDFCDLHVDLLPEMDHSIQTLTPCMVAAIPRGHLNQMLDEYPGIARSMYIAQLTDEGTLRAWITIIGQLSAMARVAHLICELYVRSHWTNLARANLVVPIPQAVLADALGMTPVHVNRKLKELSKAGIIATRRNHIVIVQPDELRAVACFNDNYLHRRMTDHADRKQA